MVDLDPQGKFIHGASGIGSTLAAAYRGPEMYDAMGSRDGRLSRDMFPMASLLKAAKVVIFLKLG